MSTPSWPNASCEGAMLRKAGFLYDISSRAVHAYNCHAKFKAIPENKRSKLRWALVGALLYFIS